MSKITVVRAATSTPTGKTYQVCELAYKTDEGKTKGMKLFGFGAQRENFNVASKANTGDVLEASFQQNDKGYWEFATLKSTGEVAKESNFSNPSQSSVGSTPTPAKSNWETTDERAARQVLIVRQSSVGNAVAYIEAVGKKATVEDVVTVARSFEDYVFGRDVKQQPVSKDVI